MVASWLLAFPGAGFSESHFGEAVCARISSKINEMLKTNDLVVCVPGSETKGGSLSLFIVLAKAAFQDEASTRAWLAAVVISTGWAMTDLPEMHGVRMTQIITGDQAMRQRGNLTLIPAEDVRHISKQFFSGEIRTVDEVYERAVKREKKD